MGKQKDEMISAFTLAEVLVTLGIIGVVAAMTLPSVLSSRYEKENVVRLEKFVSTLSQAINIYKAKNECLANISECIVYGKDSRCDTFKEIAAEMYVVDSATRATRSKKGWIPDKAYNYYGEDITGNYGGISKDTIGDCAYLLPDGTTFAMDINPKSFNMVVDVNGPKMPNRVGRDIFFLYVGSKSMWASSSGDSYIFNDDISLYPGSDMSRYNTYRGMCVMSVGARTRCKVDNLNPNQNGGASITAYTLYYKKLPPIYTGN